MTIESEKIKIVNDKCKGKVVKKIMNDDGHMDSFLVFVFTDGSKLKVHYDWIYDLYYEDR